MMVTPVEGRAKKTPVEGGAKTPEIQVMKTPGEGRVKKTDPSAPQGSPMTSTP
jgi:hypothetical protein